MTSPDADRVATLTEIIREAGALAARFAEDLSALTIHSKGVQDLVSEADVTTERLIRDRLAEAFPDDAFLGEESGADQLQNAAGVWVVDPIDGTVPFLNGLGSWCVSIAYVREATVQLGAVYAPRLDELFLGGLGVPASLNGRPISPHPGQDVTAGLTYLGASSRLTAAQVVPVVDRLLRAGGMFVRSGSGALGLCDVACGRLVGYIEPHINSWDCAGAIGVLQASGCRTSDFFTADALLVGNRIVAAPPAVYDQLDSILG